MEGLAKVTMHVSGSVALNSTVPSAVGGQAAADPVQDKSVYRVPLPVALCGPADHVIPAIQSLSSRAMVVGKSGQTKS